jgi:hypothetical protein
VLFLTFNSDSTVSGYGASVNVFGVSVFEGEWYTDAKENVYGSYTQGIIRYPQTGTARSEGSFIGKAIAGKRLVGKIINSSGVFPVNGVPVNWYPNVSGAYAGYVTELGYTTPEYFRLEPLDGYPGLCAITGYSTGASSYFDLYGAAVVSSKGKLILHIESDFGGGFSVYSSLSGTYNFRKQTGSATGNTDYGTRLKVKIMRSY